jgi:hypothetical protein
VSNTEFDLELMGKAEEIVKRAKELPIEAIGAIADLAYNEGTRFYIHGLLEAYIADN